MAGGGSQREAVSETHTHTHKGAAEDRDCPELNSTLQIGAAVFQVEQRRCGHTDDNIK